MLIKQLSFSKSCGPILIAGLAPFTLQAQHVHGVAELGVVVEGSTLGVTFEAPLADVIGFEHAPENDEQIASIRRAAETLENAGNLFMPAGAANCSVSSQSIDAPDYFLQTAAGHEEGDDHDHAGEHDHDDGHDHDEAVAHSDDDHDEHDHDDHDHDHDHDESVAHEDGHDENDHDEHDHEDHEGHGASHHSNLLASYEWSCGDVSQLNSLALSIASHFGSVETVNVQVLTPSGVFADELPGSTESISLNLQ